MEKDCLFCKISHGQMGTDFLFENDNLVVFRDINPHAPVHLLIVPKRHIRSINDLTESDNDILAEMINDRQADGQKGEGQYLRVQAALQCRERRRTGDLSSPPAPDRRMGQIKDR